MRCQTHTSAQFDEPTPVKVCSVVFAIPPSGMPKKSEATEAMDMTPHEVDTAGEGAAGGETNVDPNTHLMTWMRDHQNSYSDEMISIWPLLRPLTDGGGTATRRLAHRLLSTWQWSAATHTASCPPAPSNMEIGRWLPLDREGKKEDLWAEAYTCCLQRVAEASAGRSWETEGEGMVPRVSPLVQAFLAATGRRVSPSSVRECWPSKNDIIPKQPINIVWTRITHCLDNVATRSPSTVAGTCSRGRNRIRVFGKKIASPIHLGDGGPWHPNARSASESTRQGRELPGGGQSPQIQRTHARLRSTNQWHGVGCHERCSFIAHRGRSTIHGGFGKLLSCPTRHTGRSADHPITPRGSYCRLWTAKS